MSRRAFRSIKGCFIARMSDARRTIIRGGDEGRTGRQGTGTPADPLRSRAAHGGPSGPIRFRPGGDRCIRSRRPEMGPSAPSPCHGPLGSAAFSPETTIVVLRDTRSRELVTAGGYTVTHSKVHLGSQLTGKIKRLTVDKGDRVKAGDLIAELENESYQIEVTRATADAGVAKASADRYRRHISRTSELYRRQSISKDEFEEARRLADTSSLSYEVAEAGRAAAVCEYNKTFIRSPMSGVVVKKFLNVGDMVSPMIPYTENMDTLCTGSPIVSLVDPSDIKIEVDVSEDSIAKVRLGQSADVIPTVHPDPRLKAEVCRIAVEANRKKHAIQVELR